MHNLDKIDTDVTEYIYEWKPFTTEIALKSITTGVVSCESNADQASEIVEIIIKRQEEHFF